jgi:ribosome maturation factor RimP
LKQNKNIESKVEVLVKPIIEKLDYTLYDVQYVKEGNDYYLRIIIDKNDGISIDDCEKVNNEINDILDEADFIGDAYFLEVSSPGLERILRKTEHFKQQLGNKIRIKLFKPINKQKQYEGILKSYTEDLLGLEIENETINFEKSNIAQVKTVSDIF